MREVRVRVGGTPVGEQRTWAYPAGDRLGEFLVPIYECFLEGTNAAGRSVSERFPVLRFGVQCKDGVTATSVGLADAQTHVIKAWVPNYTVHSASSPENGAWQVYGNFLIHDGPDHPGEVFATIGCVEVMGPRGFVRFNDLVIALAGPTSSTRAAQLAEIGRSGRMTISYARAVRPPLKPRP